MLAGSVLIGAFWIKYFPVSVVLFIVAPLAMLAPMSEGWFGVSQWWMVAAGIGVLMWIFGITLLFVQPRTSGIGE